MGTLIVAEVCVNHNDDNGDPNLTLQFVDAAAVGVGCVKFQAFDVGRLFGS